MPRPSRHPALLLVGALAALLLLLPVAPAQAKLSSTEWKAAETLYKELFGQRGNAKGKAAVLKQIGADESGRAFRLMADALFTEVVLLEQIQQEYATKSARHVELTQKGFKAGWNAADEAEVKTLQSELQILDVDLRREREALLAVTQAVVEGPEALRKNILQRAKAGGEWTARAAALRVAVMTMNEPGSKAHVLRTLVSDKDPRVRMAGVDALAAAPEGWEDLVIGRLADAEWPVVLRAAAVAKERELHRAVPHLINALTSASPRVAEELAVALRSLTGENFEAYADVWSKWWEDHKDDFKSDVGLKKGTQPEFAKVHFYGIPIKSDRILFIIDVSGSMKLETKNENPAEKWKPPPTVTGPNAAPPPPPPPEAILSGPKIEVAKHELTKAIKQLPKDYDFNMISFNHGAAYWQQTMQKATDKNKESAYQWIRALKPGGSTYIDGALRMGFTVAGLIDFDKRYPDVHLDTIVLLSDGAPTDNSFPVSKLMEPETILEHVREWNKGKQVVIHCIGVDMVDGIEFLQKLAAENGGTYVDR